jgi:hypothetical protein
MGKLGKGYGSEYHLLQYRKTRPDALDAAIVKALPGTLGADVTIEWLYPSDDTKQKEPAGLGFLRSRKDPRHEAAFKAWTTFWPRGRHASWDGIAVVSGPELPSTWLLMEARRTGLSSVLRRRQRRRDSRQSNRRSGK